MQEGTSKPTIKDVAELANVSDATVSRVLSGKELVSSETSTRVMEVVEKLGYEYKKRARTKQVRDAKILIVVDNIANPFYIEIMQSAISVLEQQGCRVLMVQTNSVTSLEEIVRFAQRDFFLGMIMITAVETQDLLDLLSNITFHLVLVNRVVRSLDLNSVSLDNFAGGYRATQHLIGKGHKKVAHIAGPLDSTASSDRRRGYGMALCDAGLKMDKKAVFQGDLTKESGVAFAEYFCKHLEDYTSVFSANDLMAIAFMDEMKRRGHKIPEDVSVVGFDDIAMAETSGLTSFSSDGDKMGRVAAEMMTNILNDYVDVARKVVFPPTLRERKSVSELDPYVVQQRE